MQKVFWTGVRFPPAPPKGNSMIVCVCRKISDRDYDSEEQLRDRIMQPDFHCGFCQQRYELEFSSEGVDRFRQGKE